VQPALAATSSASTRRLIIFYILVGERRCGNLARIDRSRSVRPLFYILGMDWKIELLFIPVTDVDRAKAFYVDQLGWQADHDRQVNEQLRFVQLTPPGSACSIAFGTGITQMAPGTQRGVQVVVADADAARRHLIEHGVQASEVDEQPWGRFVTFDDPDGNGWILQELPVRP
jgi:catechol 2,3-dioxygenase-like lactoylglutathione lyase family enzyme